MTNDDFAHEIMLCFSASPVSADINATRVYAIMEQIRKDERERCAQKADMLAKSWRGNESFSREVRETSAMACDLLGAVIRG